MTDAMTLGAEQAAARMRAIRDNLASGLRGKEERLWARPSIGLRF